MKSDCDTRLLQTRLVSALVPSEFNPRGIINEDTLTELVDSIREQGILQPLVCTDDGVVLIGHRRLAAAKLLGLQFVPVVIRKISSPVEGLLIGLTENIQRNDLTPIQEANAYLKLRCYSGMTQEEIAKQLGISLGRVQQRMAILELCPEAQELIERGLPLTGVPLLTRIKDTDKQLEVARIMVNRNLTISKLRMLVNRIEGLPSKGPSRKAQLVYLDTSRWQSIAGEFQIIGKLFDETCEECGMGSEQLVCNDCPLTSLASKISKLPQAH